MSAMAMEQMQQRARQQQQVRREAQCVRPMFPEQEEPRDQPERNTNEEPSSVRHRLDFLGFAADSVERSQLRTGPSCDGSPKAMAFIRGSPRRCVFPDEQETQERCRPSTFGSSRRSALNGWVEIMTQEVIDRRSPKRSLGPIVLGVLTTLVAYGSPVYAQQTSLGNGAAADAVSHCAATQHWDSSMGMCMPDAETPTGTETVAPPRPANLPQEAGMNMPMSGADNASPSLMLQINQFMVYSNTSGPRGQSRLTGPGSWMLMYDRPLSSSNHFRIDVMASPEQLTVGDIGTPQLLQTENIDAMHAHDTIMALEFRDVMTFGAGGDEHLTFLFAPRGEAAIGPVPFMHRASAAGNPDAPLGHALQDGFHDASTVLGLEYQIARTSIEATAFSGHDITSPFPLHRVDSYGVRANYQISDHVGAGASYADALLPDDADGAEHNQFISAWLTTSHVIGGNSLKSSLIWGRTRAGHGAHLDSFLGEAVYQRGRNAFYGRAETLQVTPDQLALVGGSSDARWVQALTVGYERTLFEHSAASLRAGGSYTADFVPSDFRPAYGTDPNGIKIYLRLQLMRGW
jgi:hypothetical protein